MRSLLAALLLLSPICSRGAELIPLRDPDVGESRPSWWLACWADHVIVIEGTIRFELADLPDLELKMSPAALQSHVQNEKDRELFQHWSKFFVADVRVDKLLFASPGVAFGNFSIAKMKTGGVTSVKALIPTLHLAGHPPTAINLRPGKENTGVFIFRYGHIGTEFSLVFHERIPAYGLESAKAVFEYRDRHNYHKR